MKTMNTGERVIQDLIDSLNGVVMTQQKYMMRTNVVWQRYTGRVIRCRVLPSGKRIVLQTTYRDGYATGC